MPPVTPANVQSYASLVIKSRLMTADDVKSALKRWQETGKVSSEDVEGFRKFLVQQKHLTEYQAALLNRGHTEGYFLNQYTIIDLIGKGRMAGVYKATHTSGQVVAIKVLPPSKAREGQFLARFTREAKMLTKLNHPNVVRAFEVGQSGGRHYIVMEVLDGISVDEILEKRKKLLPVEAVRIIYQALQGLQHIHEQGMIHRDLKPANLMLVPAPGSKEDTLKSTVKILDIGLGRKVFDDSSPDIEPETQLTGENVLLGTPDYLAPEQARNAKDADIRADIYSLGCTLYHLITGTPPFPDTVVLTQVLRHATETAKPLAYYVEGIPEGLQQVLSFMMAKDPSQRYPIPERAAQALELFLKGLPERNRKGQAASIQANYEKFLESTGSLQALSPSTSPLPPTMTMPVASKTTATPSGTNVIPDWIDLPPKVDSEVLPVLEEIPVEKVEPPPTKRKEPVRTDPTEIQPKAIRPPSPRTIEVEEFDVELVSVPRLVPTSPNKRPIEEEHRNRGLLELNRRDFLMLGLGSGGVLFAILSGYGLAQLLRTKEPPPANPNEKNDSEIKDENLENKDKKPDEEPSKE